MPCDWLNRRYGAKIEPLRRGYRTAVAQVTVLNNRCLVGVVMIDVATPLLGPIQGTLVAALGATGGWIAGHLLLFAVLLGGVLAIRHRQAIGEGFNLTPGHLFSLAVFVVCVILHQLLFNRYLEFPAIPSLLLSISLTVFYNWMWYQLEPAKAQS